MAYSPADDLLFYGTGHPAPWNPDARPGDNKWTSGLFARDLATGNARWFDQINPHDIYALGAGGSIVLADLPWHGATRKLLIHPDANGQVYVLDRATGAILSVTPFMSLNATSGVDLRTGRLQRNGEKAIDSNATTRDICPGWPGATGAGVPGAAASAFSSRTSLLYIPVNGLCMDMEVTNATYLAGTPFTGADLRMKAEPGRSPGAVIAWNVAGGKLAWRADEPFPVESGILATGGDLVFYGTLDGYFKALDARTGRILWKSKVSSGIIGQPISFQSPDGKQYIAVMAGVGGVAGRVSDTDIDVRDATAAHGYANAIRNLAQPTDKSGELYVFALR